MNKTLQFLGPHIEIGARIMLVIFLTLGLLVSLIYVTLYASHRYQLDYGEAPLIDQAKRLAKGENIYQRDLTAPPYTVSNYPPLYVLLLAPFAKLFSPSFLPGRLISLASTIIGAVFLGGIVLNLSQNRLASRVTTCFFLTIPYVVEWSAHARVDMLALALSTGALYFGSKQEKTRRTSFMSAILLVAAMFTRQTYGFAAPVTLFLWMVIDDKRHAFMLAGITALLSGFLFLIINGVTHGGFYFNIVSANVNPFDWAQVWDYWLRLREVFPLLLILSMAYCCFADSKNRSWQLATFYLVTSAISALTIGKLGANINYLLEVSAAFSLTVGMLLSRLGADETGMNTHQRTNFIQPWLPVIRGALMVALAVQVGLFIKATLNRPVESLKWRIMPQKQLAYLDWFVGTKEAPILADEHMGMLVLQDRPLVIQPFEMTQLANAGLWNQANFITTITHQEPSLILIHHFMGYPVYTTRWTSEMLTAISENYFATALTANTLIFEPHQETQYGPLNPGQCPAAPWLLPSRAEMGFWWINHQLILMGMGEENTIAVTAVSDGLLVREFDWNDVIAIQHENPFVPGQFLWVYYGGMADSDNNVSYIRAEFPPGSQRIPVKKGQLLGYQGRWRNRDIWVHLGFTVIEPLEDGSSPPYLPDLWYKNAPLRSDDLPGGFVDPSPLLGITRSQVMGEPIWLPMQCQPFTP